MKRQRGNGGYIPTPQEVKELRGDKTQSFMASMIFTTERVWRKYELGESRIAPSDWLLVNIRVKLSKSAWNKVLDAIDKVC